MRSRALIPILLVIGLIVGAAVGWAVSESRDDSGSRTATTGTTPAGEDGPGQPREGTRDLDEINASLPDGFTAEIAAENLPYGTTFALDGEGGGYLGVLERGRQAAVYRVTDPDGDGVLDEVAKFADMPSLVSGFLVRPDGSLYVAVRGSILRLRDADGDGAAEAPQPVIANLPVAQQIDIHSNNGMVVGPDGKLYFGLGATCNLCVEPDPRSATIMRCTIEGDGCEVFAHGLRNAWDIAFQKDGSLWAGDNGPDPIGEESAGNQDEVNWVRQGLAYGYPFCWGTGKGYACDGTEDPAVELERRAAPSGIAFATSSAMPAEYRDNLFVTLWGGRRMVRVVTAKTADGYEATASDFVSLDRPVDVVEDEDGSLLVLDSDASRLYRITPPA